MPPNLADLRQIFDDQERRTVQYPNTTREATATVIRHVSPLEKHGLVSYATLTPANLDAVIEEQIAYYTGIGHKFNWRVMDYDTPPNLPDRLLAHGLTAADPDAVCILEIASAPAELLTPPAHTIRIMTDAAELDLIEPIWVGVERGELGEFRDVLARDMAANLTSIHVVLVNGVAVAMGGTFFASNDFANLWGGATLPDYRGQGCYRALLTSRLVEARDRGKKYLRVDCGPMSRPIVERLGFVCIGMVSHYLYESV